MSPSNLALLGGTPACSPPPTRYPRFSERAIERVSELLKEGATVGLNKSSAPIAEAEDAIANWHDVPFCLGTSSGHAALHSALIGLEITGGDEVITTPYTWGASVACILHNNAVPVFADVDPVTGLLDPASADACITPRTRAILVVHIYGQPANMTAICDLARWRDLRVIEDGSQSHGALHRGQKVGRFGDAAGFSCMGGKLLASSEAGYMVTPHEGVYWRAAMGGQHMGRSPEPGFPENLRAYADSLVYTYRLSPINAVLLVEQLSKVDAEIEARRENAACFRSAMKGMDSVVFPEYADGDEPSYHMLTMNFVPETARVNRDSYIKALRAEGVNISAYVPSPIPDWPRLQWQTYEGPRVLWTDGLRNHGIDYSEAELPNCRRKVARSLEMGWNFTQVDESAMRRLADAFCKVGENLDELRTWEKDNPST